MNIKNLGLNDVESIGEGDLQQSNNPKLQIEEVRVRVNLQAKKQDAGKPFWGRCTAQESSGADAFHNLDEEDRRWILVVELSGGIIAN